MMDHALTNQDLGSDDAASCEAPLDDTELQRRLEAHYERALTPPLSRMTSRQKWLWIVGVLAVFAMWWAFGVPQLLHGWFTDWWTMSSASSQYHLDQAAWDMLVDPNWTPAPLPTIWQSAWEDRSLFALFIGGMLLLTPFLCWGFDRLSMRYRRRILQGVKAFGLHACPDCGADTRSVEGGHCGTCRENIRRDRVPACWRHRIREDFPAELMMGPAHTVLADHAPDPRTRKRSGFIWFGALLLTAVVLIILNLTGVISSFSWLWVGIVLLPWGICEGIDKLFVPLQHSDSGWCPKCNYDLGETDSDRCPECGTACPPGSRIHLLESRPAWYRMVMVVLLLVVLASMLIGLKVL